MSIIPFTNHLHLLFSPHKKGPSPPRLAWRQGRKALSLSAVPPIFRLCQKSRQLHCADNGALRLPLPFILSGEPLPGEGSHSFLSAPLAARGGSSLKKGKAGMLLDLFSAFFMRLIYWMFFSIAQLFPACKPLCRQKFIFYTDFSIFPESARPFARKFDCSDQSFCDTIEKIQSDALLPPAHPIF